MAVSEWLEMSRSNVLVLLFLCGHFSKSALERTPPEPWHTPHSRLGSQAGASRSRPHDQHGVRSDGGTNLLWLRRSTADQRTEGCSSNRASSFLELRAVKAKMIRMIEVDFPLLSRLHKRWETLETRQTGKQDTKPHAEPSESIDAPVQVSSSQAYDGHGVVPPRNNSATRLAEYLRHPDTTPGILCQ